ncbi:MAG TPA: sensor histidine kinase [Spirochaetales bacterium]|nr:sensor histidine kinase [Spirochaetales bacterium]
MPEAILVGEAGFSFSPRFSQLIGRQLISSPIVAISELVKNSYDADADNIDVIFTQLSSNEATLSIIDDGDGMAYEDITSKWLMVGTDNKIHEPYTLKGRRKLGEKGIGRFSVERLAKKLILETSKKGDDFQLQLSIDWNHYETQAGEFSDIKHQIYKSPCDPNRKGTKIILTGLRDVWDEGALDQLRKELNLIRPIDINEMSFKQYHFPGDNIKIRLSAEEFGIKNRTIDLGFIYYYQAHLFGEIRADGSAKVRVVIKPSISADKNYIDENFEYPPDSKEVNNACGPLSYEVFVFIRDQRLYRSLDIERKKFDDLLTLYSGVKIYRDGFRILPFGDPDNDWLELNAKRAGSPEFRITTNTSVGIVYITRDENPGLQDVLNRENMYDTPEFAALKDFVNLAFKKYTKIQLSARKKADTRKKEQGKAALEDAQKSIKAFSKNVGAFQKNLTEIDSADTVEQKSKLLSKAREQLTKLLGTAETSLSNVRSAYSYYKLQDDFKSREMQIYRNIATLGISAAMFGHEALNQTNDAKLICAEIFEEYESAVQAVEGLKNLLDDLQKDINLIDEKADFFRNYLQRDKQDRAHQVNILKTLEFIVQQHKKAFEAINVNMKVDCVLEEAQLTTWGYQGDFETIFTNLITNAYKALKPNALQKYFTISLFREGEGILILAENNGKPIERDIRPKIFDPLFSTYSDGTGLGLTIIQDTLLSYGGQIELCTNYPETKFKIFIPKIEVPQED